MTAEELHKAITVLYCAHGDFSNRTALKDFARGAKANMRHVDAIVKRLRPLLEQDATAPTVELLKRLHAASTQGEWRKRGDESFGFFVERVRQPGEAFGRDILGDEDYPTKEADCDFIAAVHNHLPSILDTLA